MKLYLIFLSLLSIAHAQSDGDVRFMIIGTKASDYLNISKGSEFCPANRSRFFYSDKKTVLYIHGYKECFLNNNTQTIIKAYLSRGDHNIFIIDCSKFSHLNFSSAVKALPKLAEVSVKIMMEMKNCGLELSKIHIVGNGLGAQLAGMIGENFKKKKNFSFCRITGLDPTEALYVDSSNKKTCKEKNFSVLMPELGRDDAVFVDIIHTDVDGLELNFNKKPQGHIDFWVNGGNFQEGCEVTDPSCSNSRAVLYFAESVRYRKIPPHPFVSIECPFGVTNFIKENCKGSLKVSMGYHLVTGGSIGACIPIILDSPNFWLTTKSSSPFSY